MPETTQYSRSQILIYSLIVTVPMGVLAWVIWPLIRDHIDQPVGITFWILMIVGMLWQFIFSLILLYRELGTLRWSAVKPRIWAEAPRNPETGVADKRTFLVVIPAIIAVALLQNVPWLDAPMGWLGLHAPENTEIQSLLDLDLHHAWWILGLALVSCMLNYVLGEELFWRGVMLPKMSGAFGRWDWLVNAALFTLYHVHKPWTWPSSFLGNLLIAWPTRRYRSFWMGVIIHGIEGVFVMLLVTIAVVG